MIYTPTPSHIKAQYSLTDLATFKLCPMLYLNKIKYPSKEMCYKEQLLLSSEAEVLYDAFKSFAEDNLKYSKVYFKNTSHCFSEVSNIIMNLCKDKFKNSAFTPEDIHSATTSLLAKTHIIVSDIHRIIKGSQYTVVERDGKKYNLDGFVFVREPGFVFKDTDYNRTRSLYINEYKDFPVFSAGTKWKELIHYDDITAILDGNDILADRVMLAVRLIKKITIQLESRYENDGIERIKSITDQIKNYDFSRPCKKESGFCHYCKFYDICF